MGLVADLFESRSHPSNPDRWLIRLFGGDPVDAGVQVDQDTALSSTAVFAGIRLIAESLATVPLNVYRADGRSREVARDHPLHHVIHSRWNPELSAAEGRSIMMANAVACGNGYAEVVRDKAGRVRELWPLWPHRVEPMRRGSGLAYRFTPESGPPITLSADRVLHLRGFSNGGLVGIDVVNKMRESVGLTIATERFGARFFGQGLNPGGVLEHPGVLSEPAQKRLMESWKGGLDSAHRVKVLEEGMTFKPISVPPEAAQFLETRKFQVVETARMLNVPPHMLRELDRATFSNIEHQGIEFVRYSLRPWAVLLEQRIDALLSEADRAAGYYTKHVMEGLLRGDMKARYDAYAISRQWGWSSANDIRELEDMNPIEDGDVYLVPGNMVPADMVGQMMDLQPPDPEPEPEPEPPEEDTRAVERRAREERVLAVRDDYRAAQRQVLTRIADDVLAHEVKQVRAAMKRELRDANAFRVWLDEFYETFNVFARDAFLPALQGFADLMAASAEAELSTEGLARQVDSFVRDYADVMGVRWAARSRREIMRILRDSPDDAAAEIHDMLDRWTASRAGTVANHEATRAGSAFLRASYIAAGVVMVRWVTRGQNCPLCSAMNGKVVEIQRAFLGAGDVVDPADGETTPLEVSRNISHPPLHEGCDCGIIAEGL